MECKLLFVRNATPWRNDVIEMKFLTNANLSVLRKCLKFQSHHACLDWAASSQLLLKPYKQSYDGMLKIAYGYLIVETLGETYNYAFSMKGCRYFKNLWSLSWE